VAAFVRHFAISLTPRSLPPRRWITLNDLPAVVSPPGWPRDPAMPCAGDGDIEPPTSASGQEGSSRVGARNSLTPHARSPSLARARPRPQKRSRDGVVTMCVRALAVSTYPASPPSSPPSLVSPYSADVRTYTHITLASPSPHEARQRGGHGSGHTTASGIT
jgi:hypothetical protein